MAKRTLATTAPAASRSRAPLKESPGLQQATAAQGSGGDAGELVNIIFRASTTFRRELKRWAVDEDTTVQALLVQSLQALRRERGLPELND